MLSQRGGVLSPHHRKFWADNGFLILPGFADETELEAVKKLLVKVWEERPPNVVVDDLVTGVRGYIRDVATEPDSHYYKVNDLYLDYAEVRQLALAERIAAVLTE